MTAALTFLAPPPGLAPHVDFALAPVDGADGLFAMRAVQDAELRLYLVDPRTVLSEYAPILTDEQADALALRDAEDALILVVAHPSAEGVSVNLLAPVIVNRTTGAASQVILEDQDYPLRAPLG
ncbi:MULTISPECIES: flagellar assembly protein FliW [Microbacterium]|jgi:flagellar assembly factor FliW|uniref:Flagellar assembly protein FliW n=1 Tax=Microbacterium aurugineum TaxID=2851642 RepID=A0ABY4J0J9_9MICO|nr:MULTISPECIES: flagellar assembly protein FliW [Microbacterium]MCE0508675.1 flagellar assembly protein FliW [Microbacterium sp. KKR3/1]MCK8466867.1 flagellar assembly protein FliW [Microbacterium aurugineum]MCZ4299737.1 flagellar assembly protein FliW [Microbacterium oxydans]QEA28744.1 flagellar assembly protein FliW [Microbacterium sp. CBA3102]UPL18511.1 flagellar assembly protein FliW [Microbacterium aurugineum]